ncbi:MAG: bifunctional 4-hydroxy-3-methylbut-2-enyl diphosphate reductase/30S ribosomal protein S1 [Clostridiales Family XIII bacterium]|jgi:4-hydroxy-3-methylbut-2-enyl diphosphate reductase|nr:bifunctional 4-hydroxy-3-methylbut-2-enyl diphosphate reductase/30S ribosomal protein S1 [Clostridiales Family XIII bacterium]
MKIELAAHSGYCFGVKQSLETAGSVLENEKRTVYACGPLIHNEAVMKEFEERGLHFIEDQIEAAEGSVVIVRSHGEGRAFFEKAKNRNLEIIDATCPFVKRIHNLVKGAYEDGYKIVVAGDRGHPEVQGINGWCGDEAVIINSIAEASEIRGEKIFAVSQTTAIRERFDGIIKTLLDGGNEVVVNNTICDATVRRQDSCRETAAKVDAMLVLGGKNSANTRKLYEISKLSCKKTYFIEIIADLPLKELAKCNTIGIAAGASTPERMIKEVIANMTGNAGNIEQTERNSMLDFMEEIEKSLRLPRAGEIVTGTVIQLSNREVIINLGCKKDGVIPKDEITLESGQTLLELFKEGDEVQAKVLKTDDGDGNILLSKKKVVINEHWEDINRAYEEKSILEAKVVKEVNGGVIAVFKEIYGFIPLSQLSDRFVEKADEFINKVLPVRVTRVDQKRNKVVFSHKSVLVEERQKRLQEIWDSLHIGDVIEGTVMRFTDYGAFVDIGGIDGLLHISEISWGKLKHPQEVLKIGEKINVKILSIVKEKEKISLGYKQNQPEPWSVIDDKFTVGQIIHGKAVQIKDYGVFVELEPGLDGLVHISEIAYKRVNNISDEITVGQDVTAKILEIDRDRKRISLSIKEAAPRLEDIEADDDELAAEADDASELVEEITADDVFAEADAPEGDETPADDAAVGDVSAEADAPADAADDVSAEADAAEDASPASDAVSAETEAPADAAIAEAVSDTAGAADALADEAAVGEVDAETVEVADAVEDVETAGEAAIETIADGVDADVSAGSVADADAVADADSAADADAAAVAEAEAAETTDAAETTVAADEVAASAAAADAAAASETEPDADVSDETNAASL